MKLLSRIEEIVLLAVLRLGEDAYGLTICREVSRVTEKQWLVGAIYAPLSRLHKNGHVEIPSGPPGAEPGESRRIYYRVTPQGLAALEDGSADHDPGLVGPSRPENRASLIRSCPIRPPRLVSSAGFSPGSPNASGPLAPSGTWKTSIFTT